MRRQTGEQPVLLLDDVLSELDGQRRHFLLHYLDDGPQQAVITATDLYSLPPTFLRHCHIRRVEMGRLAELESSAINTANSTQL
jgi:DNA replication and repair protein RecF